MTFETALKKVAAENSSGNINLLTEIIDAIRPTKYDDAAQASNNC
jgi:hypothetical protein